MGAQADYPHYHFFNIVNESGGGGLEHKNTFLGMSGRFTTRTPRGMPNWLSLVSHEYFHNWNVKRLRPIELGPFDYETENYTKGLWIAEGFTDYYSRGAGAPRRAVDAAGDVRRASRGRSSPSRAVPGRLVPTGGDGLVRHLDQAVRPEENFAEHLD